MKRIGAAVAGLVLLAGALVVPLAQADVGVSQTAKIVGERPISGRYVLKFNDYGPDRGVYCPPRHPTCLRHGRAVARGKLETKLSVYKIKDGLPRFAYYLLDVDMLVTDHYGKYRLGGAAISVTNVGRYRLVDHTDTKSLSAEEADCDSVDVGFSTPWPVITASADLGSVTWCDDRASLKQRPSGKSTSWVLQGLGSSQHLMVDRAIKVRAGKKKPVFRVDIVVPQDVCTRAERGKCLDFDNGSKSATYYVRAVR